MQQTGFAILLGNLSGNLTATSHAISRSENGSDLQNISNIIRDALQQVFKWFAFWLNAPEPDVDVFTDFSVLPGPAIVKIMIDLANSGVLSSETVRTYLRSAGMLPSNFDEEREQFLIGNGAFGDIAPTTSQR